MTARTRAVQRRNDRAQLLAALTRRLNRIAAGHPEPLSPIEARVLAGAIRAQQDENERLDRDRHGLAQARNKGIAQLKAAEGTIQEVERDRDEAACIVILARVVRDHWRSATVGSLRPSERAAQILADLDAFLGSSRPTYADGTPYRYADIVLEGWSHCDGCRQWGRWTPEQPHECPMPTNCATTKEH
ncbi:hypothetical protein ACFVZH_22555 [Streptomyces sp. NPDC059534]|uniref:hypothetical protein n=1 Tax=Streptomyces sp. NPDC059534 TaxID=3346859 RepID=UPI00368EE620